MRRHVGVSSRSRSLLGAASRSPTDACATSAAGMRFAFGAWAAIHSPFPKIQCGGLPESLHETEVDRENDVIDQREFHLKTPEALRIEFWEKVSVSRPMRRRQIACPPRLWRTRLLVILMPHRAATLSERILLRAASSRDLTHLAQAPCVPPRRSVEAPSCRVCWMAPP